MHRRRDDTLIAGADLHAKTDGDPAYFQKTAPKGRAVEICGRRARKESAAFHEHPASLRHHDAVLRVARPNEECREWSEGRQMHAAGSRSLGGEAVERRRASDADNDCVPQLWPFSVQDGSLYSFPKFAANRGRGELQISSKNLAAFRRRILR